jgi:hypothetical protein
MPIPPWVYPVWAMVACVPILAVARYLVGKPWTASVITATYLLYRLVIWPLLVVSTFPPSVPPFWMLGIGLAVDAVFLVRLHPYVRAVVGGLLVTGVGYGVLWLQTVISGTPADLADMTVFQMQTSYAGGTGTPLAMPPVAFGSIWWALPGAVVTWLAATYFLQRTAGLDVEVPPPISVRFSPEPARAPSGHLLGLPYEPDPAHPGRGRGRAPAVRGARPHSGGRRPRTTTRR